MKIIYSADNRLGAAQPMLDFINHTSHEVRVAAYPRSGRLLSVIDWNLDAAKTNLIQLQRDIQDYYPDFVLIDCEPVVANIAAQLDIPILYCSALHLLDGVNWKRGSRDYSAAVENDRRKLRSLPPGIAKLIYSCFGDLEPSPSIKDGFEWVQPYHATVTNSKPDGSVLLLVEDPSRDISLEGICQASREFKIVKGDVNNDSYLSSLAQARSLLIEGTSRQVADAIYNQKHFCICPKIKDTENLLNASICANMKYGLDLGQIELAEGLALEKIEDAIFKSTNLPSKLRSNKKLHERIDELWECM